jgi:ABC-type cobalamin/Fe3+-siderophores transport system ATPase subunit
MLELKNICFERDNKNILDNINLVIDTNKLVVITGPNRIWKINIS